MFVCFISYSVYVRKVLEFERWKILNFRNGECFLEISDLFFNIKYVVCVCVYRGIEIGFVGSESDVIIIKSLVFKMK